MVDTEVDENEDNENKDKDSEEVKEKPKLNLDVQVELRGACQRHVLVTISPEDVARYFNDAFSELMPKATVPGFRSGRAPRKLVESKFRGEVSDQVKGNLLMDSLSQITAEYDFSAISEPDIDLGAIEIPDEGPLKFEFDLEVRPEFELPKWKGLKLDRPTHEFSDRDIDGHLETQISRKGRLVPFDGAAEAADYVVVNITFSKGPDLISRADEQTIRIRRHLSFPDGRIDHIDKLLIGTKAGDTRQTQIAVSHDAPRDDLHGVKLDVNIEVLEVKRLELPKLDDDLLERLGGHKTEEELRAAVKRELELRLAYHQQQSIRAQIADLLTASAELDLPPEMVRRQSKRELDRASLELRSSGFAEDEIQARENELRRNSVATTRKALKEHFIFERIADEESLDASEADYDAEIERIAAQSQEPPRRIRARIEKRGMMDALRNQIVERKVVELIASHATFRDVPFEPETNDIEAIEHYVCGQTDVSIPVAKHAGEAKELPHAAERG